MNHSGGKRGRAGQNAALVLLEAGCSPKAGAVRKVEAQLREEYGKDFQVFIRTRLTVGMTSSSDYVMEAYQTLDGIEGHPLPGTEAQIIQVVELLLKELIEDTPGAVLRDIDMAENEGNKVVYVTYEGPRAPKPAALTEIEKVLRKKFSDDTLSLVVHFSAVYDITSQGVAAM